jgi:hypothetical protein
MVGDGITIFGPQELSELAVRFRSRGEIAITTQIPFKIAFGLNRQRASS